MTGQADPRQLRHRPEARGQRGQLVVCQTNQLELPAVSYLVRVGVRVRCRCRVRVRVGVGVGVRFR